MAEVAHQTHHEPQVRMDNNIFRIRIACQGGRKSSRQFSAMSLLFITVVVVIILDVVSLLPKSGCQSPNPLAAVGRSEHGSDREYLSSSELVCGSEKEAGLFPCNFHDTSSNLVLTPFRIYPMNLSCPCAFRE